jgi:hypothetical protein
MSTLRLIKVWQTDRKAWHYFIMRRKRWWWPWKWEVIHNTGVEKEATDGFILAKANDNYHPIIIAES